MKRSARVVVLVAAAMVPTVGRASANGEPPAPSLAAVRVVSDAGEMHGTAVLIRREDTRDSATLYFLTSARLFRGPDGNYQRVSKSVTLRIDKTLELDVNCNDVFADGSGLVDVAILRATAPGAVALQPTPLVYGPPPVGAAFLLSGIDEAGGTTTVSEHVRFESTLLVLGDRDAPSFVDCLGTPAVTAGGVFGIVRECDAHRAPVISLLTMARSFLERHLPSSRAIMTVPVSRGDDRR
jgi:hypothetical protein